MLPSTVFAFAWIGPALVLVWRNSVRAPHPGSSGSCGAFRDPLSIYKIPSAEVKPADLSANSRDVPRLKGKTWALVKLTRTFEPEDMEDLEFEPLLPLFRAELNSAAGNVRFLAALACGRFGLKEPKAVEMLLPVAPEGSQYSSEKAQQALARISGKQFEFPEQWEEWWQAAKTGHQFASPAAN